MAVESANLGNSSRRRGMTWGGRAIYILHYLLLCSICINKIESLVEEIYFPKCPRYRH
jgi:hypothetical protein